MHNEHFCIVSALECYIYIYINDEKQSQNIMLACWLKLVLQLMVACSNPSQANFFKKLSGSSSIDSAGFLKPPVHRFLPGLAGFGRFSPVQQHNRSVEQLEPVTPPVPSWTGPTGGPVRFLKLCVKLLYIQIIVHITVRFKKAIKLKWLKSFIK